MTPRDINAVSPGAQGALEVSKTSQDPYGQYMRLGQYACGRAAESGAGLSTIATCFLISATSNWPCPGAHSMQRSFESEQGRLAAEGAFWEIRSQSDASQKPA
jgi:hypothetical protein